MANKSVVLSLLGKNSGAIKAIEETDVKIDGLKHKSGEILIGADTAGAQGSIDRLQAKLDELKHNREIMLGADPAEADAAIAETEAKLDELKHRHADIPIGGDPAGIDAAIAETKAKLDELKHRSGTVYIKANVAEIDAAIAETEAKLKGLKAKSDVALGGGAASGLERKTKASGDSATVAGSKYGKAGLVIAGGLLAAGYESTKLAIRFNGTMEQIHTQAGVAQGQLKFLGDGVLALAAQVGQSPDSLAKALYHVESSFASLGISGPKALNLVKIAAEGATVGHADLVDVTNALDATIASGIPGVKNYSQAMGALNAVVGSGDMKMQDLADAMGTGVLAVVKNYGLSLTDVGAALATFGDNNIRGADAATGLRMAVQALSVPAKAGQVQMEEWGLTNASLANSMMHGGLKSALQTLTDLFAKHGISTHASTAQINKDIKQYGLNSQEVAKDLGGAGEMITKMFGKKAGTGLAVLMSQMDRFKSKYKDINSGADKFGSDWKAAAETPQVKLAQLKDGFEAMGITLGNLLLPAVSKVLGGLVGFMQAISKNKAEVFALVGILSILATTVILGKLAGAVAGSIKDIGTLAGMFKTAAVKLGIMTGAQEAQTVATEEGTVAQGELNGVMMLNPIGLVLIAVAALAIGFYELWKHFKGFRDFWKDAWRDIKDAFHAAFSFIKDHWMLIGAILLGPVAVAVLEIAKHWGSIKKAFSESFDWIKNHWVLLLGFLTGGIVPAVVFVVQHWGDIQKAFGSMFKWVTSTWAKIPGYLYGPVLAAGRWINGVWSSISKGASDMLDNVITFFYNLPNNISNALGNLTNLLYNAGWNIMVGFWNGLVGMWNKIVGFISGIAGWISSHKGPIEVDAVLLVPHGKAVMGGLVNGLQQGMPGLNQQLGKVTNTIAGTRVGTSGAGRTGGAPLQVEWIGGHGADQRFVSWLKDNIRIRGGDPGVLGR